MNVTDFRFIDAKTKLDPDGSQVLEKGLQILKKEVKPKNYQAMAFNGSIIFEAIYHPDATLSYKIPRKKVNYNFENFPEHLQPEIQKLQEELKLTKVQIQKVLKICNDPNVRAMDTDKQKHIMRNTVTFINKESAKEAYIRNFYRAYSSFNECLTSELKTFDIETKNLIIIKLNNLVDIIDDVIKEYLT